LLPLQSTSTARTPSRRAQRRAFSRWKASRPLAGSWFRLTPVDPPQDAIDLEELRKDRVRLLLDRYGVVFRELLLRELPPLRWAGPWTLR